jgi:hypothetical protein
MKKIIIVFMMMIIVFTCGNSHYKEDMDLVIADVVNKTQYNIKIQYKDLMCVIDNDDLHNQYNVGDKIGAYVIHTVGKNDKIIDSKLTYK